MKFNIVYIFIFFLTACATAKRSSHPIELTKAIMTRSCDLRDFYNSFKFEKKDGSLYYFIAGNKLEKLVVESPDNNKVTFAQIMLIYNNQYGLNEVMTFFSDERFKLIEGVHKKSDLVEKHNSLMEDNKSIQIDFEEYSQKVNAIVWKKCLK